MNSRAAGKQNQPGHRREDDQQLEGFDPEIEAQHALGPSSRVEPEAIGVAADAGPCTGQASGDEDAAPDGTRAWTAAETRIRRTDGRSVTRERPGRRTHPTALKTWRDPAGRG